MDLCSKKKIGILAPSPNKKEHIAASALLLFLSLPPPPPSFSSESSSSSSLTAIRKREAEDEIAISISYGGSSTQETASCITDSCSSSSLTAEVDQIDHRHRHRHPLRLLELAAVASRASSFLRPKVVKKARSKIQRKRASILSTMRVVYDLLNSHHKDQEDSCHVVLALSTGPSDLPPTVGATATVAAKGPSCPSSIATAVAARTKRNPSLKAIAAPPKKNQDKTSNTTSTSSSSSRGSRNSSNKGSQSINRRAVAILNWLAAVGSASEVKIREAVGDSPDTSKALRLLLKRQEVNRTGAGGRIDPYLYELTPKATMQ